jgi:hypothetical protein
VRVALRQHHLHRAVLDGCPLPPRMITAASDAAPGRGLLIVEGVAAAWGLLDTAGGKVVWATLRLRRRR